MKKSLAGSHNRVIDRAIGGQLSRAEKNGRPFNDYAHNGIAETTLLSGGHKDATGRSIGVLTEYLMVANLSGVAL